MSKRVRWIAVLVAIVFLAAGTAQAMPRTVKAVRVSESGSTLTRILDWLTKLLQTRNINPGGEMKGVWEGEGSHIDPNGLS